MVFTKHLFVEDMDLREIVVFTEHLFGEDSDPREIVVFTEHLFGEDSDLREMKGCPGISASVWSFLFCFDFESAGECLRFLRTISK